MTMGQTTKAWLPPASEIAAMSTLITQGTQAQRLLPSHTIFLQLLLALMLEWGLFLTVAYLCMDPVALTGLPCLASVEKDTPSPAVT